MAHEEMFIERLEAWFGGSSEQDLLEGVKKYFAELDPVFKVAVVRCLTFDRMIEIYSRKGIPYLEEIIREMLPHVELRAKKDLMLLWKRVVNRVNKNGRLEPPT